MTHDTQNPSCSTSNDVSVRPRVLVGTPAVDGLPGRVVWRQKNTDSILHAWHFQLREGRQPARHGSAALRGQKHTTHHRPPCPALPDPPRLGRSGGKRGGEAARVGRNNYFPIISAHSISSWTHAHAPSARQDPCLLQTTSDRPPPPFTTREGQRGRGSDRGKGKMGEMGDRGRRGWGRG